MVQTRRSRDPLPLNRIGGLPLEAFQESIRCWPLEIHGWNWRINSYEQRKIALGNTALAQRYFHELLLGDHATPTELYACAWVASRKWQDEGYVAVPHLSTFFGPEQELWANFLDEARTLLEAQAAELGESKSTPCAKAVIDRPLYPKALNEEAPCNSLVPKPRSRTGKGLPNQGIPLFEMEDATKSTPTKDAATDVDGTASITSGSLAT